MTTIVPVAALLPAAALLGLVGLAGVAAGVEPALVPFDSGPPPPLDDARRADVARWIAAPARCKAASPGWLTCSKNRGLDGRALAALLRTERRPIAVVAALRDMERREWEEDVVARAELPRLLAFRVTSAEPWGALAAADIAAGVMRAPATPELDAALAAACHAHPTAAVRGFACKAAVRRAGAGRAGLLLAALDDPNPTVAALALRASCAGLKPAPALDAKLLELTSAAVEAVRGGAFRCLLERIAHEAGPAARLLLARGARDRSGFVRGETVRAVHGLPFGPADIAEILPLLDDATPPRAFVPLDLPPLSDEEAVSLEWEEPGWWRGVFRGLVLGPSDEAAAVQTFATDAAVMLASDVAGRPFAPTALEDHASTRAALRAWWKKHGKVLVAAAARRGEAPPPAKAVPIGRPPLALPAHPPRRVPPRGAKDVDAALEALCRVHGDELVRSAACSARGARLRAGDDAGLDVLAEVYPVGDVFLMQVIARRLVGWPELVARRPDLLEAIAFSAAGDDELVRGAGLAVLVEHTRLPVATPAIVADVARRALPALSDRTTYVRVMVGRAILGGEAPRWAWVGRALALLEDETIIDDVTFIERKRPRPAWGKDAPVWKVVLPHALAAAARAPGASALVKPPDDPVAAREAVRAWWKAKGKELGGR